MNIALGILLVMAGFAISTRALRISTGGVATDPFGFLMFLSGGFVAALGFAMLIGL